MLQSGLFILIVVYGAIDGLSLFKRKGWGKGELALKSLGLLESKSSVNNVSNVRNEINGNIEFLNVSFRFGDSEKLVFQNLNLKIGAGIKVAFVGLSEEAKSAISILLKGLENPLQGDIIVDGANLKDYDVKYLRDRIGVISKHPVLFDGTIRYNIK